MSRSTCLCRAGIFTIALAVPAHAQTRLLKPTLGTPVAIVAPSTLSAWSPSRAHVTLTWPAVAAAEKYRLTRIDNTGAPEIPIVEAPLSWFVFEGATCTAGTSQPTCIFDDVTKILTASKNMDGGAVQDVKLLDGVIYPHAVESGRLYTYRAWAIFPGPVVSPPSPPATVQVK